MERNVIVYHHTDSDGLIGLYIISAFELIYNGQAVLAKPSNYGQKLDYSSLLCGKSTDVYFVDFIPDQYDEVISLAKKVNSIKIIDHHISKKDFAEKVKGIKNIKVYQQFKDGISGGMLAHDVLFPEVEPFELLKVISNFDTWHQPNGKEAFYNLEIPMNIGFMAYHNDEPIIQPDLEKAFIKFYKSAISFERDEAVFASFYDRFIADGKTIFKSQQDHWKKFAQMSAFEAEIHGKKAICLNIDDAGSMQFDAVFDPEKHDMMFGFSWRKDHWSISIYSTNYEKADAGELCKKYYQGGGHQGAGGGYFYGDIFKEMKIAK